MEKTFHTQSLDSFN